jgi:hypothetical protein
MSDVSLTPSTEATPSARAKRGKARQPTAETLVAATSLLPRRRMAVTDGAPVAADVEAAVAKKRTEDEAIYRQLLGVAAENAEPAKVAAAMGWSESALDAFLEEHKQFAVSRYEVVRKRHTATPVPEPAAGADFVWTDDRRRRLIEKYVDRGDLLEAQQYVGCTPSQFNRERDFNSQFARTIAEARKEARETLKLRATKDALDGNDKLLTILFKDLEGEQTEGNLSKLTDAQLQAQLNALLNRIRGRMLQNGNLPLDSSAGMEPPKVMTNLAGAEANSDVRRDARQKGMEQRMQNTTAPNSTDQKGS